MPPLLIAVCGVSKKCPDLCSLVQNMSCSAENILLAAHAGGLGACWLYVYDEEMPKTETEVKRELRIPDNIRVLALIAIGYPNEKPLADNKDLKSYHKDKWGIYER